MILRRHSKKSILHRWKECTRGLGYADGEISDRCDESYLTQPTITVDRPINVWEIVMGELVELDSVTSDFSLEDFTCRYLLE